MMSVLYIYSGSRKGQKGTPGRDFADTQLYGMNHLAKFGVEATYMEWLDITTNRLLNLLVPFRLKHLALYPFTIGKDIVFGASLLYLVPLKKLFRSKTAFVLLNIGMLRTFTAHRHHPIRRAVLTWMLGGFEAIVCLARVQKEHLEKLFPTLRGKIHFIHLGVDIDYFRPQYEGRKSYVVSAGRDNGRDYKTVVETARLMPHIEFHIVCSARNLQGIGSFPANVKVFTDLPPSELQRKYHDAGALFIATHDDSYEDGSDCSGQTVLLEAMANGIPVVASQKRYLSDYAEAGSEILLVPFYDPVRAAETLRALLADPARGIELAKRARARIERECSTEKMAEEIVRVFVSVVSTSHECVR